MRHLIFIFLVMTSIAYAGTNTVPVITSDIIRKTHINQYQTAITGDWVPRNSSGVATDDAGALGSNTTQWGNSFLDSVTLGAALNGVELLESLGDFQLELNGITFLETDDTDDEFILGPAGSTDTHLSFRSGTGAINSTEEMWINIDADNTLTTDRLIFGKDAIGDLGQALFVIREDANAWFLDAAGTAQTIIFNEGLGDQATAPDIGFKVHGLLAAESNMYFTIDSDVNNTTRAFEFRNNSDTSGSGTRMMHLVEGGPDGATLSIGEVGANTTNVFQACMSSDCTALYQIRGEGQTTLTSTQFNDSGAVNGFFIENESTTANTSLDMFDVRSNDTDATGMDMMEFQDGAGVIGRINVNSTSSVAYNTTSDARLKENERPIPTPLATLLTIEAYEFEWREDSHVDHGMYAQELKQVYPLAVSGDEDGDPHEDPMSIDYAKMVPLLVAAVQELHVKVEMLEDELTTLKGSALTPKIERGPVIQVNDYTLPSYVSQVDSAITCTDLKDCREKYEDNRAGCNTTFALHRLESSGTYSLECRKVTGYAQKNTQSWVRR